LAFVAVALAAGCGGTLPPAWQTDSSEAMERFRVSYFDGDSRRAARDFNEAKRAIGATGRLYLGARAELVRCAYGTAALDFDACSGFEPVREDATAEDRAYAAFLFGTLQAADIGRLPEQYRDVARAPDDAARSRALAKIEDPVSRLVAAGALFRQSRLALDGVTIAIDAASAGGMRRPLLAWLNVELKRAEAAGDAQAVARVRRRIELASGMTR
jgi:hypothetical protein